MNTDRTFNLNFKRHLKSLVSIKILYIHKI